MAQKVDYIIELKRQGDGATQAAAQLNLLKDSSYSVGLSVAAAGTQLNALNSSFGAVKTTAAAATQATQAATTHIKDLGGQLKLAEASVKTYTASFNTLNYAVAGAGEAAKKLKPALDPVNNGLVNFNQTAKVTTSGLKVIGTSALLLGGNQFPRLTLGLVAVQQAMQAMRAANVATISSLTATSAGIAGVVAALTAAVFAWQAYKAEQLEKSTAEALAAQTKRFAEELREQIHGLREAGEITEQTFLRLSRSLRSAGGLQEVRDFLSDRQTGTAADRIADFERRQALNVAIATGAGNLKVAEEELNALYSRRLTLYKELQAEGLMTNKEAADASDEAALKENQRLQAFQKNLTEIQQLNRAVAQDFASGLSSAIVQFASGTKSAEEAFKSFAATFMQQTAQMILQLLIMRAIKSSFGWGFADGGQAVNAAARGGFFPILAANGVNGVREVSTPTYFPKFNVLAGEAGREVMTVMARPRLMNVGGIAAQVGDVGPNRLAITNANDLQRLGRGGGGGSSHLRVSFEPGLRGEMIESASNVAVEKVTRKMGQRSALSERTRRLVNS